LIELYYLSLLVLISTLIYISFIDMRERRVQFKYWYPLIIIGSISTLIFIIFNFNTFDIMTNVILIITIICFFLFAYFKIIGGADALALIFITIFSITIPFNSILNNVHTGIGISTFINALILSFILQPIYNIIYNLSNDAEVDSPFYYMMFAQRITTKDISNKFGYIIPSKEYLDLKNFITNYKSTNKLLYTKELNNNPIKYTNELLSLKERGMVWVFNAVPFIVYITLGFLSSIIIGDFYNYIVKVLI
jgi:archaeal preflagellin peptidase FlaK